LALVALTLVVVLDVFASVRVVRSEVTSVSQKVAWLVFVWLAPILGAIWALQMASERSTPAPVSGSYGTSGLGDVGLDVGFGSSHGGHGSDGGSGDASSH
jgi:hypothetical protein